MLWTLGHRLFGNSVYDAVSGRLILYEGKPVRSGLFFLVSLRIIGKQADLLRATLYLLRSSPARRVQRASAGGRGSLGLLTARRAVSWRKLGRR